MQLGLMPHTTMTELIRHPRAMKKALNETREIIGSKPNISEDDLENMQILESSDHGIISITPATPLTCSARIN